MLLEPVPSDAGRLCAHAIKLKHDADAKTEGDLKAYAKDVALAQAQRLSYGHGLSGSGLFRWGLAFSGKQIAVTCVRADG